MQYETIAYQTGNQEGTNIWSKGMENKSTLDILCLKKRVKILMDPMEVYFSALHSQTSKYIHNIKTCNEALNNFGYFIRTIYHNKGYRNNDHLTSLIYVFEIRCRINKII